MEDKYRYAYQGQFSERDLETGWSHFELREYDPVVGRWTSKDPAGQYHSPYVAMGNNPVRGTDPDGGWVKGAGLWNNMFKSDSRIYAEQYAASWSSDNVDYFASKSGDAWGVYAVDKTWIDGGSDRYRHSTLTYVNSDGSLGETASQLQRWDPATGEVEFDALTQLTLGFIAVNSGVAIGASTLRVSTAVGRSLFWSGVRSSAAAEFAAVNGLTTLEMTTAGSFLNATQGAVLPIFRNSLWRSMSARFASQASGEAFMLSGYSVRTGGVWMQIERQVLMNNSRVTGIHFITGF